MGITQAAASLGSNDTSCL